MLRLISMTLQSRKKKNYFVAFVSSPVTSAIPQRNVLSTRIAADELRELLACLVRVS
jgi:hypothetical protein